MKRTLVFVRAAVILAALFLILPFVAAQYQAAANLRAVLRPFGQHPGSRGDFSTPLFCFFDPVSDPDVLRAYDAALKVYEREQAAGKATVTLHRLAGQGYCLVGAYEKALKSFTAVTSTAPGDPISTSELLALHARLGNFEPYQQIVLEGRASGAELGAVFDLLIEAGDLEKALDWARFTARALPGEKEAWYAWYRIGLACEDRKDPAAAAEVFRQALAAQDEVGGGAYRGSLHFHLGLNTAAQGTPESRLAAFEQYQAAIADGRFTGKWDHSNAYIYRGNWLRDNKANENAPIALADYLKALEINPKSGWAAQMIGIVYLEDAREYSLAEDYLRQAVALSPTGASPAFYLGEALALQEKYDEALAMYQQALDIDPNFQAAREKIRQIQELKK